MSLKFLAVGQSFAGLRNDKSPYAVRKENQLPVFESVPRFKHPPEQPMVQTDWLEQPRAAAPASSIPVSEPVERQMPVTPPPTAAPVKPRRLSFFGLKWFRTNKSKADLVQSELSLEKVQPVRNDLADADLRLVLKRKARKKDGASAGAPGGGWSELTAKLFELGQK